MRRQHRVVVALAVALLVILSSASIAGAEDIYSQRTIRLAREIHCPICVGESIADSQTELARQMRGIIEEKVQAGETDQQIKDYFVARYGESILFDPPKSGFRLGLWWMPLVAVALGAVVVATFIRERTRAPRPITPVVSAEDEELETIAREALGNPSRAPGDEANG
ncbi:MAG: cytochrome c-type biogenesis protein CcmH [Thermomicrobiales bacterium]|nr:cytochrome c-type biogenesis protein CcmH [Thermomicrobiales bacterium]